ncbi:amino acid ABC transporter permease [Petrocella sp. FN5]|uniref:amino acid ABC transporter permease n=1 Tax=Petrocella sp. FN5 TaxID=3032002 RepID=UPI0023DACEB1|nr:ABC transporter permease subunit [Petrocella sp. FN5]MDF1616607.1 ABC transporter permease subunit [Petrocella sp. FN5]
MKNMRKTFGFVAALVIYCVFFYYVMTKDIGRAWNFEPFGAYSFFIFRGWLTTIYISFIALLLALFIGLILYLMEQTNFSILHYLAVIHKNIIFGTPLLVIAIVAYYYIGNAFEIRSKILVGTITLGLYIGAYVSDIYKGAIESIHINQWQTAKMFGFTRFKTYRYIVFPQVIISILPPLAGQFALTIKGSALLSFMGTSEYYNRVNNVIANTYLNREGFLIMTLGYLLITIPLIKLVRYLEVRLNYKN